MKKKIAVCASGWSNEYLKIVMSGIRSCAKENNADIFLLMNYVASNGEIYREIGEGNIFRLLDYDFFDGMLILGNTLHTRDEYDYLTQIVRTKDIPSLCLEYKMPDIEFLGTDNYSGMHELMEHLICEHKVKSIAFVSGPPENEENNVRKKALEDVLKEHGLSLPKENVIVCNWNFFDVVDSLPIWIDEHGYVDAFVCANDVMAMATCSVLKSRGKTIPGDVLVTGYDCLESGLAFIPSIATVSRNWDNLGYLAMKSLLKKMNKEEIPAESFIPSMAVPAQSCGCELSGELFERSQAGRETYFNLVNNAYWGGHLCDITEQIGKSVSPEELHKSFSDFLRVQTKYEGKELYICVVDNFFSSITDGSALRFVGYTPTMDVIVSVKDGIPIERHTFETKELIPAYDSTAPGGRFYAFAPFYNMDGCYGYVVFGEELSMMYDYSLYNWMRNLTECFGHVRQNIMLKDMNQKLEILSVTDGLTGVYNRMGCEKIAYPYLEECHQNGKRAVMMFADINKMKRINDNYGHIQGDIAIVTVARSIKEVLTDRFVIVRYGGDEFLMVGECETEHEAQTLLKEIVCTLHESTAKQMLPYKLDIGVGFVFVEPEEKLVLSDCLRRADEAMYDQKRKKNGKSEGK